MDEQFGAVCMTQIDGKVYHVVALAHWTDKVCILLFVKRILTLEMKNHLPSNVGL